MRPCSKSFITVVRSAFLNTFGNNLFPDDVLNSIEDQGLTEQEIFEIIGLISLKTISNYVNNYLASVKTKHLSKRTN